MWTQWNRINSLCIWQYEEPRDGTGDETRSGQMQCNQYCSTDQDYRLSSLFSHHESITIKMTQIISIYKRVKRGEKNTLLWNCKWIFFLTFLFVSILSGFFFFDFLYTFFSTIFHDVALLQTPKYLVKQNYSHRFIWIFLLFVLRATLFIVWLASYKREEIR